MKLVARLRTVALLGALAAAAATLPACKNLVGADPSVRFESGPTLSVCARGTITLFIDGGQVGTMTVGQSQTFPVTSGSHTLRATSRDGNWGPRTVSVLDGQTFTWTLTC
jgi:hypothetical protein